MNNQSRDKRKAYEEELLSYERANPIEFLIQSSRPLLRVSGLQILHSCPSFGHAVQSAAQSEHDPTRIVTGAGWAAIMVSANVARASPHLAATCRVRSHDCEMLMSDAISQSLLTNSARRIHILLRLQSCGMCK
jgi:hypothetical protein